MGKRGIGLPSAMALAMFFAGFPAGSQAGVSGPQPSLDPLWLGELGFRQVADRSLEAVTGLDLRGFPAEVRLEPALPSIVYFFPSRLASSRATLGALDDLRSRYGGKLGFVALTPDLHEEARACVAGLSLGLPLLAESGLGPSLGVSLLPGYAVVAPGGRVIARREGSFDWSSEAGQAFIAVLLSMYPSR